MRALHGRGIFVSGWVLISQKHLLLRCKIARPALWFSHVGICWAVGCGDGVGCLGSWAGSGESGCRGCLGGRVGMGVDGGIVDWFLECVAEAFGFEVWAGGAEGDWAHGGGGLCGERSAVL